MGDASTAQRAHTLRAGWTRVIMAFLGLVPATLLLPELDRQRGLFAAYLVIALVQQFLIWKNIGGELRAVLGGFVDITVLTVLVHRVGSVSTLLVGLYVVVGMLEALVHPRRVALLLATTASLAYAGVLFAEASGVLPYAPDRLRWVAPVAPDYQMATMGSLLVTTLLLVSALIVSDLVAKVREREEELIHVNAQLAELSLRDPLTQLYNRRHLLACLERELARARRGHAVALVMLDLDGFKRVNDERGHLQGDEVLRRIANALEKSVRVSDVLGRYGGDEFAVLLPDTDAESAERVAQRLVDAVREAGSENRVTASVGIAVALRDDDTRSLQTRADEAAYRAKQKGGDRFA
jgi:diguanylate cyclase (GGDEF)-like protein